MFSIKHLLAVSYVAFWLLDHVIYWVLSFSKRDLITSIPICTEFIIIVTIIIMCEVIVVLLNAVLIISSISLLPETLGRRSFASLIWNKIQ